MISVLTSRHHRHNHMALLDPQIQRLLATMLTAHLMVHTHQHSMGAILHHTLHINLLHRQEVIKVQISYHSGTKHRK